MKNNFTDSKEDLCEIRDATVTRRTGLLDSLDLKHELKEALDHIVHKYRTREMLPLWEESGVYNFLEENFIIIDSFIIIGQSLHSAGRISK